MSVGETELNEYWALLREIEQLAFEDVAAILRSLEGDHPAFIINALKEQIPELAGSYRGMAADTAMLFYEETQGLALDAAAARAASVVPEEQLLANLRWSVFSAEQAALLGNVAAIVQKTITDGSRQYGMQGFVEKGGGWYRAAQPGACAFCRMLATRAATEWGPYTSASATVFIGEGPTSRSAAPPETKFHKNCHCIPVRAESYVIPEHVNEWTEVYYRATEEVGNAFNTNDILAEMRRISGIPH